MYHPLVLLQDQGLISGEAIDNWKNALTRWPPQQRRGSSSVDGFPAM